VKQTLLHPGVQKNKKIAMNFGSLGGRRSVSPTSSRASSPVPRFARQAAEDGICVYIFEYLRDSADHVQC
jgi:hypothetical protein